MRQFALLIILTATSIVVYAQKAELNIRLGSGLGFFSGKSTVKEQDLLLFSRNSPSLTMSYGKTPGFSLTAGGSVKKLIRHNWFWEAGVEFQSLSSTSGIKNVAIITSSTSSIALGGPATGTSVYRANFISFAPLFGKRIGKGRRSLDITAGPEFALQLNGKEKIDYKSTSVEGHTERNVSPSPDVFDLRIQFQAMFRVKKIGLFTGYTKGLSNYYSGVQTQHLKAYSNFIRLGFAYQLK